MFWGWMTPQEGHLRFPQQNMNHSKFQPQTLYNYKGKSLKITIHSNQVWSLPPPKKKGYLMTLNDPSTETHRETTKKLHEDKALPIIGFVTRWWRGWWNLIHLAWGLPSSLETSFTTCRNPGHHHRRYRYQSVRVDFLYFQGGLWWNPETFGDFSTFDWSCFFVLRWVVRMETTFTTFITIANLISHHLYQNNIGYYDHLILKMDFGRFFLLEDRIVQNIIIECATNLNFLRLPERTSPCTKQREKTSTTLFSKKSFDQSDPT